jgi:anti-sigma factor RsiW
MWGKHQVERIYDADQDGSMGEKQKKNPRVKRRQAMKARRTLGTLAALVAIALAPASMAGESAPQWDGDGVIEEG